MIATINRKLSEISRLDRRTVSSFHRLPADDRRAVVERLETVTAVRVKEEINERKRKRND